MSMVSVSQHDATVGLRASRCLGLLTQLHAEQRSCPLFSEGMFLNGVLILMSVRKQTTS